MREFPSPPLVPSSTLLPLSSLSHNDDLLLAMAESELEVKVRALPLSIYLSSLIICPHILVSIILARFDLLGIETLSCLDIFHHAFTIIIKIVNI